jgi:hypothetical protein
VISRAGLRKENPMSKDGDYQVLHEQDEEKEVFA